MNSQKLAGYTALILLIGGFGILGSMTGIRVAFSVVVNHIDCAAQIPLTGPKPCQEVLLQLNELTKILLAGGFVSMLTGGVGMWLLQRKNGENDP